MTGTPLEEDILQEYQKLLAKAIQENNVEDRVYLEQEIKNLMDKINPRNELEIFSVAKEKLGDLQIKEIVEYIKNKHDFIVIREKTTNGTPHLYVYKEGSYCLTGDIILKQEIKSLLEERQTAWKSSFESEILKYIYTENVVDREDLIQPPHLICVNNGVLNIETGRLGKHSPTYHFFYKIPVNYDSKATCPMFKKYLKSTIGKGYLSFIQEIAGYCLYTRYDIAMLLYLYGTGGNGKKIFLKTLEAMMGNKNVSNTSIDKLVRDKFASSGLYGKLLNACGELSGKALFCTDMLKALTGGDSIEAEFKNLNAFSFENYAKVISSCNKIPKANDTTPGWYQRQYVIPFLNKFRETAREDTNLLQKTTTKEELEGILIWAVEGLRRFLNNKKRFSYPGDHIKLYQRMVDPIDTFLREGLTQSEDDLEEKKWKNTGQIYEHYKKWSKKNSFPIYSFEDLNTVLNRHKWQINYGIRRGKMTLEQKTFRWTRAILKKL